MKSSSSKAGPQSTSVAHLAGAPRRSRWTTAGLLIGAALALPPGALAQQASQAGPGQAESEASWGTLAARCAARPVADPFLAEVERARNLADMEASKAALEALEPEARQRAEASPNDVTAQYHLAAVLGARLDHESGGDKIEGANAVRDQAARVLELDPDHPGASYMMGKIHASALRLGGFKRFLATTLLGGSALKNASWEEAQALLETAVREDPCVPEHHFELARVYAHHGDTPAWERELAFARELTAGRDGRQAVRIRERADELEKEWRAKGA